MTGLAAQLAAIELVGPKGYEHGWHFVGIPAIGTKIRMPGGRLGEVIGGDHQHARIRTANGDIFKIPHDKGPGAARLVKDTSKPEPAPYPKLDPERMKMKLAADKSIAAGETLFHGTNHEFKPGDIIDAQHSRRGVTMLHEGKQYAFASTDAGEATFAGRAGREGHAYRVEPVGQYEYDPHQGSATSRRTSGGFRVVEEVQKWSGKAMATARKATAAERKAYVKTGELPSGVSLASQLEAIELAAGMAWLHELRDAHGEWTRTPADKVGTGLDRYTVPAHERLINPRADHPDPADYPFFKKHPVSADNIIAAYDATPKGLRDAGMHWYSDAHLLARALAHGNAEEGAILLANYSPQANWPINMFRAARVADEGKPIPAGEGYVNNDQVKKAWKALNGESIDQVLISPKTRSFAHLLAQGDDSPDDPYGHVVIDAHALNVAAGGDIRGATYGTNTKRKKLPPEDQPPIATDVRAHEYVGDMYRQAAKYISERDGVLIKPHQMQAITWVGQVLANQAEDRAAMEAEGGAKGRLAARAKDWKRWLAYAKGHHFALMPGVSSLAGQIALARLIELSAGTGLSSQLADLAAWEHELRDPKGEWARTGGIGTQLLERERDYQQTRTKREARHEYPMIGPEHARGNSRPVSAEEFQQLARKGNSWLDKAKRDASPITALDGDWDSIKHRAWGEVQKPWGGATIDAHTGEFMPDGADRYALTVKPRGMVPVHLPETISEADFKAAMDQAKEMFRPVLERQNFQLGVFHDDDLHQIDIDPVAVVDSPELVEQVGSYTHALGGAYHFKTGNGYWPPHVASGADMAADENENTIHWLGPGQWHSQAAEIQEPEPEDEPIDE